MNNNIILEVKKLYLQYRRLPSATKALMRIKYLGLRDAFKIVDNWR